MSATTVRTPTHGRNNQVPFTRPKPSTPKRNKQPKQPKQPKPRQPSHGRDNSNTRGRNQPHNRINQGFNQSKPSNRKLSQGFNGGSKPGRGKSSKKPRSFIDDIRKLDEKKVRKVDNLSDGLINQTGKRIGRRVIQSAGGRAVGKIVQGASVVGKIQKAWDLGTGIGGLGRGLLGIDDINPYGDMPGFGAAELAWDLGDTINNLITNPNEENVPPNVASENQGQSSTSAGVKTNKLGIEITEWPEWNDDFYTDPPVLPDPPQGEISFPPMNVILKQSINQTGSIKRWSNVYTEFGMEVKNTTNTPVNLTRVNYVKYESLTGFKVYGSTTDVTVPNELTEISSIRRISYYYLVPQASRVWIGNQLYSGLPTNDGNYSSANWKYSYPSDALIPLVSASYGLIAYAGKKSGVKYVHEITLTNTTIEPKIEVLKQNEEPQPLLKEPELKLREVKPMACKALDAMKAMEQRINALEANLNKKLGEEAIEKIEIETTTIDENGEEIKVKEEIELDGIGGTVAKILQNQYQEKESDNEEILKRLGDPVETDTQLPNGETLAAAGIGIGGLAGLALLTQKKLGKEITKLPTFNNAGTPTNIIPEVIEADTGGIGGGIDKINREMQENKHETAKKHKLDLRANLIQLLDLALSIHNAFALSSSLIDTIVSFMNNVFQMFGFKDENDQPIDVKEVVGESFENLLKILLGAETAEDVIKFFVKTNRIIQTGANVLFDLQGLTDSVRSISQQTGEYVAKIGNALKRNRIVPDDPEDSYGWMDEKMTPRSAFQKRIDSISEELQNVTDFMGSLESVTSEVISAQEQFGSLKNNAIEFKNLVTTSEAEKTTAENEKTADSQSPEISIDSAKPGE